MDLRDVMAGVGSADFGDEAVARSRARVLAGIGGALESAASGSVASGVVASGVVASRPAAAGVAGTIRGPGDVRRRRRWSGGALAAVAAVIVVSFVAVGAMVTAQWLAKAPTAGEPTGLDLSAPLLAQLEPGEYLRIATDWERSRTGTFIGEDEYAVADAYLRVREVESWYVPADDGEWTLGLPEYRSELVSAHGPDADALVELQGWLQPPDIRRVAAAGITRGGDAGLVVSRAWLDALPDDAHGMIRAFADRYDMAAGADETVVRLMLVDPTLLLLDRAQRATLLGALSDMPAFEVVGADGTVTVTAGDPDAAGDGDPAVPTTVVFRGPALLPLSGEVDRSWYQDTGSPPVPADTWTVDLSIVSSVPGAPPAPQPADPGVEPDDPEAGIGPDGYWCSHRHIPLRVLDDVQYAEDLDAAGNAALREAGVWPTIEAMPEAWIVVSFTDRELVLFTDRLTMQPGGWLLEGAPPDHQVTQLYREGAAWAVMQESLCALQHDLGELDLADVELDPAHPPRAGDEEIHFLVTERACNSGQPATGRVELESGFYDGAVMEVTIGVRPTGETADCPGNPPTPFVFELKSPWVEGTVVRDATYVDPRELPMP